MYVYTLPATFSKDTFHIQSYHYFFTVIKINDLHTVHHVPQKHTNIP